MIGRDAKRAGGGRAGHPGGPPDPPTGFRIYSEFCPNFLSDFGVPPGAYIRICYCFGFRAPI